MFGTVCLVGSEVGLKLALVAVFAALWRGCVRLLGSAHDSA